MPSKLENAFPLFINARKWVGSSFTSGLLHDLTQVKVKEVYHTEWTLHLKKFILPTQKCYCEVGIIIIINLLFKLAVSSIHHLNSNREKLFAYIFFLYIKLQEAFIEIQLASISKFYLKFRHGSALSKL